MRGVLGLAGLFNILIGLGFLFNPTKLAAQFALSPIGIQGLATARADFPAFFLTGGLFALAGAWRTDPKPLIVPLVLLGTALTGRFVSIALDGVVATTFPPMLIEAAMIAAIVLARRSFTPGPMLP
ncbi:MAG: hypothetical protein ACOYLK_00570 [Sphingomonas sp.]|jgi:hypothetical protein